MSYELLLKYLYKREKLSLNLIICMDAWKICMDAWTLIKIYCKKKLTQIILQSLFFVRFNNISYNIIIIPTFLGF